MSTLQPPVALKSNVIGLLGATTLGIVFLSPAMTLYGLFGPIFLEWSRPSRKSTEPMNRRPFLHTTRAAHRMESFSLTPLR